MTDDEENGFELMSEEEKKKSIKRFNKDVAKGLCSFCGAWWKTYGHRKWCKQK